jgi:ribonuclease Z
VARPLLHIRLVNRPFGDPGVHVGFMFEKQGLLFDLGDLAPLSDRRLLRVVHVFVSHCHMDHFTGLDRLVRIFLGRDKNLRLFGPPGFIDRVRHKLAAFTWNLVGSFKTDFTLTVSEFGADGTLKRAALRSRAAFEPEPLEPLSAANGVLVDSGHWRVRAAMLDHGIPCLGFALEERLHINVWRNKVEEMGFRVGPWLRELKQAILRDEPDDAPFRVRWREDGEEREAKHPLGELKERLTQIVPGQKIAYVTDVGWSEANCAAIADLARDADIFYIEAPFLDEDAELAAGKNHLTAAQAGALAREVGAKRFVPFHFSPRYGDREQDLRDEANAAFRGGTVPGAGDVG